jgi:hypothetical protein
LRKKKEKVTHKSEILKFWGIIMAVAFEQRCDSVRYWFSEDVLHVDSIFCGWKL